MRPRTLFLLWLVTDLLLFLGSYALAYFIRVWWVFSTDFPFNRFILTAVVTSLVWLLVMLSTRALRFTRSPSALDGFLRLVYANIVASAFFALMYFFAFGLFFSRMLLVLALLLSTLLVRLWNIGFGWWARQMLWRDPAAFPTLIVGVTRESRRLIERLSLQRSPLKPVAVLDGRGAKEKDIAGVPVLGKLDRLEDTFRRFGITHLVQCSDLEQSINLLSACRAHGITYALLPSVLGVIERDESVESLEGWSVTMVRPPQPWWMGWVMP